MLPTLDYPRYEAACTGATLVPVYREIVADLITPVSAFLRIGGPSTESFLLESVEGGERVARYSFLGRDPFLAVRVSGEEMAIEERRAGTREVIAVKDPRPRLKALLARYQPARFPGLPRFCGGAVGYFAYDAVRWIERLPPAPHDDTVHDEMVLRFYDTLLAFDHARRRLLIIANAHLSPDADAAARKAAWEEAQGRIDALMKMLRAPDPERVAPAAPAGASPAVSANMSETAFSALVETALEKIRSGEIFQVVLSQRFARPTAAAPFDIYRALRAVNPSPYMFFLGGEARIVLGSSPEPLVRLTAGRLEYRPIAGTAPRGADDVEDARLAEALKADEKERAEHVMLVDLGRNDLGRVAVAGSIEVRDLMVVERYSHVMHLVSRLEGRLAPGFGALDVLFACLPAGTVSGAPKVRAMEIINALEPTKRGIYAGAVGYIDFAGDMDTCIALRTMVIQGGVAYVQAGAGIVADSQPAREFRETAQKARALLAAVELAEGGLD